MPPLGSKDRAKLPDSAFAYVDSRGRRRLPIHDAPHVRNALARFNQVEFENDGARDRARIRLLRAARKHGVETIGFVNAQLQPQRKLPAGMVTLLLADIEGSTELLARFEDRYAHLLADVRRMLRAEVRRAGGREVDARADDFFAAFERAPGALGAALEIQRKLQTRTWPDDSVVRLRIGIHRGRPTLTDSGYVGLAINTAARICSAAHGGQIVVSAAVRAATRDALPDGVTLDSLGRVKLRGLTDPVELFQVAADDLPQAFPPLRAS